MKLIKNLSSGQREITTNWLGKRLTLFRKLNLRQRTYTRYIILGHPRTGSNLLRGMLNENRHVVAFGELFRFNDSIGWDYPGHDHKVKIELQLINDNPIRFLKKMVFKSFPPHIRAVGFKIFYFHAHNENWEPVWTYLRKQKDIKILHIKRENVLKTYLSHTRALNTNNWIDTSNKPHDEPPITLEYDKCLRYFEQIRRYEEEYDDFFKGHDKLELIYEKLAASYKSELKRVTDFLGVPAEDTEPVTFQQARSPLFESIANYRELKEKFQATTWAKYFED